MNKCYVMVVLFFSSLGLLGISGDSVADTQKFAEFPECRLLSGDSIAPCRIGYRTFGALNAEKTNAVLILTWYTGTSADLTYLVSPDLLDPNEYFIVIVDALANGVSSSPSNNDGRENGRFPQVEIADMVDSQHRLLTDVLDIHSLQGIVGLSMGGMQAFEWAVRYPDFSRKTVTAISSPRLPSFDIATWTIRIRLLSLYRQCECLEALEAMEAVSIAYLVPKKVSQEIARNSAASVISDRATARFESFSVGRSWDQQRQAEAMIRHDVSHNHGYDMNRSVESVKSELLVIVGADDRVVTKTPAQEFAELTDSSFVELDEDCGHGDPWCAADEFSRLIRDFLGTP